MIVFEQFNIRAREGIAQAVADIQRQLGRSMKTLWKAKLRERYFSSQSAQRPGKRESSRLNFALYTRFNPAGPSHFSQGEAKL